MDLYFLFTFCFDFFSLIYSKGKILCCQSILRLSKNVACFAKKFKLLLCKSIKIFIFYISSFQYFFFFCYYFTMCISCVPRKKFIYKYFSRVHTSTDELILILNLKVTSVDTNALCVLYVCLYSVQFVLMYVFVLLSVW